MIDPFIGSLSALRTSIAAAKFRPEPECLPPLIAAATLSPEAASRVRVTARRLVDVVRRAPKTRGVEGLVHEYSLSSEEGVALMCLAEALLRIPDAATRDALIRDKVGKGNWRSHLGLERSLFVNAATWGLMVTGALSSAIPEEGLAQALTRLIARGGEPIIRTGMDVAMRMMGEQFVTGETIGEALTNARSREALGFRHSYDMLGEAAANADDAERYFASYAEAIAAIGAASQRRGPYDGPGISVKLTALHPRYERAQQARVMTELLPRVRDLALAARRHDIGFNVDAEDADRLDISLDVFEALCADPDLAGWDGLGFVVQAYGKRAPLVIDWLIDTARRNHRRLMVRLVKGAYWDSEIKQAQVRGLADYPVFTRKVHTDVSYLACAAKMLAAKTEIYPQFATHNAQTIAAIHEMAGPHFRAGDYEFQCLHGMGERLYAEVVPADKLGRPCRIYAPVGTHRTLLAYLVRRLLENGANSSFVNQLSRPDVPVEALVANPVEVARAISPLGAPHPQIPLPAGILGERLNSAGLDLTDDTALAGLDAAVGAVFAEDWDDVPYARSAAVDAAFAAARLDWADAAERAKLLRAAADRLQSELPRFVGLIVREARRTIPNAVSEVREAIDFLRYYADRIEPAATPLGTVVCISPWNFPLSIFLGQVAGALAAGNAAIAKPAEETPRIGLAAIALLHAAGIPAEAVQVIVGAGEIGAALTAHPDVAGVAFTGSYEVAKLIEQQLAKRGRPIPFIAETGGQNAMIVDSSALTEQVVADVLVSAFDSAGQRCSALRLLCLQDDIADRTLAMLKGAMRDLRLGDPAFLATDVGPVITAEAGARLEAHIAEMRRRGHAVTRLPLPADLPDGTFVPPAIIEIDDIGALTHEVFGPVLHVVRFDRTALDATIDRINALGFGLTFGLHTRLDATVDSVTRRISAGNLYVNRNIVGAVVGVQPFGGHGLSGTGPKAGGPLYIRRLAHTPGAGDTVAERELPGPVGERNLYRTEQRGDILCLADTEAGLREQLDLVARTGNTAVVPATGIGARGAIRVTSDWRAEAGLGGVLVDGDAARVAEVCTIVAAWGGPLVPVQWQADGYDTDMLVREVSLSINTAAAGGNASLMSLGA